MISTDYLYLLMVVGSLTHFDQLHSQFGIITQILTLHAINIMFNHIFENIYIEISLFSY